MAVVMSPSRDGLSGVVQTAKPVLVKADIAKASVEALDKNVLGAVFPAG